MRVRLCGAFEGSKVCLQVAFPHSAATQERHLHSCSQQRHLLVGSEIHCWIKISISRLAADTIRDTSVTSADLFVSLFGDDRAIMAIWQNLNAFLTKPVLKALLTSLVPQKYFSW